MYSELLSTGFCIFQTDQRVIYWGEQIGARIWLSFTKQHKTRNKRKSLQLKEVESNLCIKLGYLKGDTFTGELGKQNAPPPHKTKTQKTKNVPLLILLLHGAGK